MKTFLIAFFLFLSSDISKINIPEKFAYVLELPLVQETTCESYYQKEYPCEVRIKMGKEKNYILLVVYSKDKKNVIWISMQEIIFGTGMVIFDGRITL